MVSKELIEKIKHENADKDFDEVQVVEIAYTKNEAEIIQADSIQRFNLIENGYNESIPNYDKWLMNRKDKSIMIAAFHEAMEKGLEEDEIDYELLHKWDSIFKEFLSCDVFVEDFCQDKEYTVEEFVTNTKHFIHLIDWIKELKKQQASDKSITEWCSNAYYDEASFRGYTYIFRH